MSVYCPGRSSTILIVLLHEAGQRLYFKDLRPHLDCYCACSQPSASLAFKPFFEHAPARSELEFYAAFPLTLMTMPEHFKRHWKQFEFDNMDVAIWTRVAICVRGSNLNSTDGGCGPVGAQKRKHSKERKKTLRLELTQNSWPLVRPATLMVINAQSAAPPQLKPLRCHTTQALKLKDVQLSKKKLSTEEKKGGRGRVDWGQLGYTSTATKMPLNILPLTKLKL